MPNLAAFNCQHKEFHLFSAQLPLATRSGGCVSLNAHISISIRIMKRLGVHLAQKNVLQNTELRLEAMGMGLLVWFFCFYGFFFFPRTQRGTA